MVSIIIISICKIVPSPLRKMRGLQLGLKLASALGLVSACIALHSLVPCPSRSPPRVFHLSMRGAGGVTDKFVPAFVGVWAVGYTTLAYLETSSGEGLGDKGGAIGVAGVVLLALGLFIATAYETFKE